MPRPVDSEEELQKMGELEYGQMRKVFRDKLERMIEKLKRGMKPVILSSHFITGPMLADMIQSYMMIMN